NFYCSARQLLSELCPILQPSLFTVVAEECPAGDAPMPPVYVSPSSPAPQMAHQPPFQPLEEPLSCPEGSPSSTIHEEPTNVEPHFCVGFAGLPCRSRNLGQKNARRKRDLVLSKLVHNVHNHIANEKRFDGAESIKSSWNISVVKFLLEKLKHELVSNHHNYTDKELKGELSEYRNSLNPFKGLKEKEEKKLRSRRYRVRQLVIPHVLGMSCLVKRRIGVCYFYYPPSSQS
uniref:Chromosome 14 open reading frame 93 n=1 Tax=Naja naja TaxID=35670 RepID=A0A8C6VSU8_NAJNA